MRHIPSNIRLLPALIALALSAASSVALADAVEEDGRQPVQPATTAGGTKDPGWVEAHEDATQPVQPPVLDGGSTTKPIERDQRLPVQGGGRLPRAIVISALEDQPADLDLGAVLDGLSVLVPPKNGTLLADTKPMRYVPNPDFHGEETIEFGTSTTTVLLHIKVSPVNDAPRFKAGDDRAHAIGDAGAFTVPGWAQSISAGPWDEKPTQRVAFNAQRVEDPAGVVASMQVAPDGTLSYTLTGRPGVATWSVQAIDDGGNLDGGVPASAPKDVRIGVGVQADLAIKMVGFDNPDAPAGTRGYQLLVSNLSKEDALGTRVADVLPKEAGDVTWRCEGYFGGICPKIDTGHGEIYATVDLPGHAVVVFTVEGMRAPVGHPGHVAFVEPPGYVADPDLSNNEARQ